MASPSASPLELKTSEKSYLEQLICYYSSTTLMPDQANTVKRRLRKVAYNALLDRLPGPHCCLPPWRSTLASSALSSAGKPLDKESVRLALDDYCMELRLAKKYIDGSNGLENICDRLDSQADMLLSTDSNQPDWPAAAVKFLLLLADNDGRNPTGRNLPGSIAATTSSTNGRSKDYRQFPVEFFESAIGSMSSLFSDDDVTVAVDDDPRVDGPDLVLPDARLFHQRPGFGLGTVWAATVDAQRGFDSLVDVMDGTSVDDWQLTNLNGVDNVVGNSNNNAWRRSDFRRRAAAPASPDDGYTGSLRGAVLDDGRQSPQSSLVDFADIVDGAEADEAKVEPLIYSWLHRGRPAPPEAPYLTEAGPAAFDSSLAAADSPIAAAAALSANRVSLEKLCLDTQALMMGLASVCFPLAEQSEQIIVLPGLAINSCTPGALARLLEPLIVTGRQIRQLKRLLTEGRRLIDVGQIASAFLGCLEAYLNMHESLVLSAYSPSIGPIQLVVRMRPMCRQASLVYNLCCANQSGEDVNQFLNNNSGLKFLQRLEASLSAPAPLGACPYERLLLTHFLQESSRPYLRRLHDWVQSGLANAAEPSSSDSFDGVEFPVVCNPDYASQRSVGYWRSAYSLISVRQWPLLPHDAQAKLFFCGKSINLLRLLDPKHPLLTSADNAARLALRQSAKELAEVAEAAERRYSEARQAEWSARRQRAAAEAQRAVTLRSLAAAARLASAQEFEALQAIIGERRRAELKAKREQVEALKREAERARQAKAETAAAEAAEVDRALAAVEHERRDLEDRVRQELLANYARLTDAAARRELRALWRLQRRRLDERRAALLSADDAYWAKEMADAAAAAATDAASIPSDGAALAMVDNAAAIVDISPAADKPSEVTVQDKSSKAIAQEKPSEAIAQEKPSEAIAQEKPSEAIAQEKPSEVIAQEKPSKVIAQEKPSEVIAQEKPSEVIAQEKPSEVIAQERPSEVIAQEKPSEVIAQERPSEVIAQERPSEVTTQEKPSEVIAQERPLETRTERFIHANSGHGQSASRETNFESATAVDRARQRVAIRWRNPHGHPSDQSSSAVAAVARGDEREGSLPAVKQLKRLTGELDQEKIMSAPEDVEAQLTMLIEEEEQQQVRAVKMADADEAIPTEAGVNNPVATADSATDVNAVGWTVSVMDAFQLLCDQLPMTNLLAMPRHNIIDNNPSASSVVATDAVERLSIATLASRSLWTPLQVQARIVNSALVTQLLYEADGGLLRHLRRLRRFCFLADGSFSQTFVELATKEDEAAGPDVLVRCLRLAEEIVRDSEPLDDQEIVKLGFNTRLTFGTVDDPRERQQTQDDLDAESNGSSPLDRITFNYEAGWPANLILTDSAVARYTRLMRLLLRLSLTVGRLTGLFSQLRRDTLVCRLGNSQQARCLQLWRHEMEHAVKAIGAYACHQTLDLCWSRLSAELNEANDLEAVRASHDGFLRRCLQRCLLEPGGERLLKHVRLMLSLAERFCRVYRSHAWIVNDNATANRTAVNHPQFEALARCRDTFRQNAKFLFGLLARLRDRAAHLDELVLRLDFNGYYGLADGNPAV